ncbi:MAG: DNA recombination protein RmuC [Proteobacteria bacterium]|jgi:DNA recombination protein RmuC|nr:DNA recombination protein RmuC [Pseudomonadota bacterium]
MNILHLDLDTLAMLIATGLLGAFVVYLIMHRKLARLREQNTQLVTTLELEQRNHTEKLATLEQARDQLADTFSALSSQALRHNSEEFLKLAQENLKRFQSQATGELDKKEKAIEHLLHPIREALEKTEQQIRFVEKERKEAYGALHKHLETMAATQANLQSETRNLVKALRRPEVRGQWGEMTLKRLVELAGMVEHCDFYEQETVQTTDGRQRPDMIVRLPDGRDIVVDVKTPLDAYLNAVESTEDEPRQQELVRHARNVRQRVTELASKAYWSQFSSAPDFVVLFIPGEQFLSAALDQDRSLLEDALAQHVILATPTSFVALLRAIAYGWRQDQMTRNAEKIRDTGEDLYKRLLTFTAHLQKLGNSLDSSIHHYNRAVGSFDSRVIPGAQKFTEMGINASEEIEAPDQIEVGTRSLTARDE